MSHPLIRSLRTPLPLLAISFAGLFSAACNDGNGAANVVASPGAASQVAALGNYSGLSHPDAVLLSTAGNTVQGRQLVSDSFGNYFRTSIGVPVSAALLRTFTIGAGGNAPFSTTAELAISDRSDCLAVAVCVPAPTIQNAAACDLIAGIAPQRAGLSNALRHSLPNGLFQSSAQLAHGKNNDWFVLHDGLFTLLLLDHAMQPLRAMRFDNQGLLPAAPLIPLLLDSNRAVVACGVRAADGAIYHFVAAQNGATLQSIVQNGITSGPIAASFSEALELANGYYATRHFVQPAQGASHSVLCVFDPTHTPIAIVEDGSASDLQFAASNDFASFTSNPIVTKAQQWQPCRLTLSPGWDCDESGIRGTLDTDGAILTSTTMAHTGVIACLATDWSKRFAIELPMAALQILATSSQRVLACSKDSANNVLTIALIDRCNGTLLASHRLDTEAGGVITAHFAKNGLSFVLAIQGAATRLVIADHSPPIASDQADSDPNDQNATNHNESNSALSVRAYIVTKKRPATVGTMSYDDENDLFRVPLVNGRTLFVEASALHEAAVQWHDLDAAPIETFVSQSSSLSFGVAVVRLPSQTPIAHKTKDPTLLLPQTSTATVQIESRDLVLLHAHH